MLRPISASFRWSTFFGFSPRHLSGTASLLSFGLSGLRVNNTPLSQAAGFSDSSLLQEFCWSTTSCCLWWWIQRYVPVLLGNLSCRGDSFAESKHASVCKLIGPMAVLEPYGTSVLERSYNWNDLSLRWTLCNNGNGSKSSVSLAVPLFPHGRYQRSSIVNIPVLSCRYKAPDWM